MAKSEKTTQQKKLYVRTFSEALERFGHAFAIYNKDYSLIFANAAAFKAMPSYFNALKQGKPIRDAIELQIRSAFPQMPDPDLDRLTDIFLERSRTNDSYEVAGEGGTVTKVTNHTLSEGLILGLGMDVTKLKNQKTKLETLANENYKLAITDQLTGLSNRRQFVETLERNITEHQSTNTKFFTGLIDLNGFKRINDIYGHAIGDSVLATIADRATSFLRNEAFLARLGGDEFAIIMQRPMSPAELLSFSENLCEALRQPQTFAGNNIAVSASLGWASFPKDGKTASDLLRKSDYALYQSKNSKSGKPVIFSEKDEKIMRRNSQISLELETANLEEELYLEFHPIHCGRHGKITAFESLARWNNATLGIISPVEFIPLAEKVGQIGHLSKILLKKSLKTAESWPKSIDLHFNLSAIDLGNSDQILDLIKIIKDSKFPRESVVFEVTETALINTFENISDVLNILSENEIRLALDDFGTGFSSLSYLTKLPVTCIKVDKSFTDRLTSQSDEEKVLKTIRYLCENLDINCVVEGVESQSQLDQLMSLKLELMQGFHFTKPLKIESLAAYLLNNTYEQLSRSGEAAIETLSSPPKLEIHSRQN